MIRFAVIGCIPVLLGVIIGIFTSVVMQLPTDFIGPETPATPFSFQLGIPVPQWDQHLWLEPQNPLWMRLLIPSRKELRPISQSHRILF